MAVLCQDLHIQFPAVVFIYTSSGRTEEALRFIGNLPVSLPAVCFLQFSKQDQQQPHALQPGFRCIQQKALADPLKLPFQFLAVFHFCYAAQSAQHFVKLSALLGKANIMAPEWKLAAPPVSRACQQNSAFGHSI